MFCASVKATNTNKTCSHNQDHIKREKDLFSSKTRRIENRYPISQGIWIMYFTNLCPKRTASSMYDQSIEFVTRTTKLSFHFFLMFCPKFHKDSSSQHHSYKTPELII